MKSQYLRLSIVHNSMYLCPLTFVLETSEVGPKFKSEVVILGHTENYYSMNWKPTVQKVDFHP